ncbi:class I SAM-dependent DNA methyltransferase [Brevundimonas staleyi]|uniref:site-specific DNA-methyltransferase (adenine-specific) n=1 Tax=Brevundimonas staleyi TaxID=74326 RepID=A0ABW0FRV0_9CAUL
MTDFVGEWGARMGVTEQSHAHSYLNELMAFLGVTAPRPPRRGVQAEDYRFEQGVRSEFNGQGQPKRVDLYKRDCFVLEMKATGDRPRALGLIKRRPETSTGPDMVIRRGWEAEVLKARRKAQQYVFHLPPEHATPPFLLICDLAHGFEVWADFSGTGRGYAPFPNRDEYRFAHEELAYPEIQARLQAIWDDPRSLDPGRNAARVTRAIAGDLSKISRRLESDGHAPEEVAQFILHCVFTMFAADVGLLSKNDLIELIGDSIHSPRRFPSVMTDLWKRFDMSEASQRYAGSFTHPFPRIDGGPLNDREALPLEPGELRLLLDAASARWGEVEPAIFGSLLEQALSPDERRRLGAHYTPRRYVETVVEKTVMEPLWSAWDAVRTKVDAVAGLDRDRAIRLARTFHLKLCRVRVLDPACGTGNFLYVSLERMKRLEAEVVETLERLGAPVADTAISVEPRQFFGLDKNPQVVGIAKLMLWIGWLQEHYRSRDDPPNDRALAARANILHQDAILGWDGAPIARFGHNANGADFHWPDPHRPDWPEADFIVGNPPFAGGKDLRSRLDPGYAEALRSLNPHIDRSADLVMYWWDRAAEILARPGTRLKRFGFVTTNSISQILQRRTVERRLNADRPISLVHAIPDHPWTRATRNSAAVRIAVTVAEAGRKHGVLTTVLSEADLETDAPVVTTVSARGRIAADLTLNEGCAGAFALRVNERRCFPGMKLHGSGFVIAEARKEALGHGSRPGLAGHLRRYRSGRDVNGRSRDAWVIDMHGLELDEVAERFPEIYDHLARTVLEGRLAQRDASSTADARGYADRWWLFGKSRPELRAALTGLSRYIVTAETAKHRTFRFLEADIVPDNTLICVADDDAATLSILSSRAHAVWCAARGGRLEDRPRYTKTACFDPFPFPPPDEPTRAALRDAGEKLEAHRQRVLAENPDLTLTGLYNLLAAQRSGKGFTAEQNETARRAQLLRLGHLHETIDGLTAQAYGWPTVQTDAETLAALIALNRIQAEREQTAPSHSVKKAA